MKNAFWSNKKVFLTGHTGFKGSWLTATLKHLGATVRGYSLAPATTPNMFDALDLKSSCEHIIGDINNLNDLRKSVAEFKPDVIFHLAAQALVRLSYAEPLGTFETNVLGTAKVLEAAHSCPEASVVVITSDKCYENKEWEFTYRENDPLGGKDPYSASKACTELVAKSYMHSFPNAQARLVTARAGNVIGGGDWSEDRIIPDIVRAINARESLTLRNPQSVRPWQHVLEPISGYLLLAQASVEKTIPNSSWNFGPTSSELQTVGELVNAFVETWGCSDFKIRTPDDMASQPHEANLLMLDSGLAQRKLKWAPRMGFREMLKMTTEWYQRFYDKASSSEMSAFTEKQIADYFSI